MPKQANIAVRREGVEMLDSSLVVGLGSSGFILHRLPLCRVSREGPFSPLQRLVDIRLRVGQ